MSVDVTAPLASISTDAVTAVVGVSIAILGLAILLLLIRSVTGSINDGDMDMSDYSPEFMASAEKHAYRAKHPTKFKWKEGVLVPVSTPDTDAAKQPPAVESRRTHVNLSGNRHPDSLESQHSFSSSEFF